MEATIVHLQILLVLVKPIRRIIAVVQHRVAPTATPTEIILANVSPTVATLLKTGTVSFLYAIPGLVILVGLLL